MLFLVALFFIAINFIVALEMSKIAHEKGFTGIRYFHYSFWLGPAGWFIVVALPDLEARPSSLLQSSQNSISGATPSNLLQDIEANLPNL